MPISRVASLVLGMACAFGAAACGCRHAAEAAPATTPVASAPVPVAAAAAGGENAAQVGSTGPAPITPEVLHGAWVEYWALSGRAETQRYTFMPDGRFGWCSGPDSSATPARRWGRFSLAAGELVLSVQGEDARRDCDGSSGCRSRHEPAVEQRFPLGVCPPNDEARALDAHYRCISVAGQAFWLGTTPGKSDAEAAALAH